MDPDRIIRYEGEVFHDWSGINPEFNLRNLTEYPESERMVVKASGRVVVPNILHNYLGKRVRVTVEPADLPPSPARGDPMRCNIHGCWCIIESVSKDVWDPDWFCPQCDAEAQLENYHYQMGKEATWTFPEDK